MGVLAYETRQYVKALYMFRAILDLNPKHEIALDWLKKVQDGLAEETEKNAPFGKFVPIGESDSDIPIITIADDRITISDDRSAEVRPNFYREPSQVALSEVLYGKDDGYSYSSEKKSAGKQKPRKHLADLELALNATPEPPLDSIEDVDELFEHFQFSPENETDFEDFLEDLDDISEDDTDFGELLEDMDDISEDASDFEDLFDDHSEDLKNNADFVDLLEEPDTLPQNEIDSESLFEDQDDVLGDKGNNKFANLTNNELAHTFETPGIPLSKPFDDFGDFDDFHDDDDDFDNDINIELDEAFRDMPPIREIKLPDSTYPNDSDNSDNSDDSEEFDNLFNDVESISQHVQEIFEEQNRSEEEIPTDIPSSPSGTPSHNWHIYALEVELEEAQKAHQELAREKDKIETNAQVWREGLREANNSIVELKASYQELVNRSDALTEANAELENQVLSLSHSLREKDERFKELLQENKELGLERQQLLEDQIRLTQEITFLEKEIDRFDFQQYSIDPIPIPDMEDEDNDWQERVSSDVKTRLISQILNPRIDLDPGPDNAEELTLFESESEPIPSLGFSVDNKPDIDDPFIPSTKNNDYKPSRIKTPARVLLDSGSEIPQQTPPPEVLKTENPFRPKKKTPTSNKNWDSDNLANQKNFKNTFDEPKLAKTGIIDYNPDASAEIFEELTDFQSNEVELDPTNNKQTDKHFPNIDKKLNFATQQDPYATNVSWARREPDHSDPLKTQPDKDNDKPQQKNTFDLSEEPPESDNFKIIYEEEIPKEPVPFHLDSDDNGEEFNLFSDEEIEDSLEAEDNFHLLSDEADDDEKDDFNIFSDEVDSREEDFNIFSDEVDNKEEDDFNLLSDDVAVDDEFGLFSDEIEAEDSLDDLTDDGEAFNFFSDEDENQLDQADSEEFNLQDNPFDLTSDNALYSPDQSEDSFLQETKTTNKKEVSKKKSPEKEVTITDLSAIPEISLDAFTMSQLNLDHRSGFILSMIDGIISFDDILDLSILPQSETLELLSVLIFYGVIKY